MNVREPSPVIARGSWPWRACSRSSPSGASLSYANIVPTVILPTPTEVLRAFPVLHFQEALVRSIGGSLYRVYMGFLLAAVVAIPLGLLMGTFPPVKHFFVPLLDPLRFLPISALVPLFIVWFGIDEMQKIMLPVRGHRGVPAAPGGGGGGERGRRLPADGDHAGGLQGQLIRHVLIPGSLPAIGEALRVMNGIGWTYVILAEVINARYGLGYLITVAGKRSHVDQIFALVHRDPGHRRGHGLDHPHRQQARCSPGSRVMAALRPPPPTSSSSRTSARRFVNPDGKRVPGHPRRRTSSIQDEPGVGEFRVFLGPSGCGKSTILNIVAGLFPPTTGEALVRGKPVTGPGPDRGMVFQSYSSYPWLTVLDNVAFGLMLRGVPRKRARGRPRDLDQEGRPGGLARRSTRASSRAACASGWPSRARWPSRPQIILMDEPFGALDVQTRLGMQNLINELWEEIEGTILFVTHDIAEAVYLADKIHILSANPGTIVDEVDGGPAPAPHGGPEEHRPLPRAGDGGPGQDPQAGQGRQRPHHHLRRVAARRSRMLTLPKSRTTSPTPSRASTT